MFRFHKALAVGVVTALLLVPAVAQARWLRAESPHFIVYGDGGEGSLRKAAQALEEFDRLLRRMHAESEGMQGAPKLEVYLVEGLGDLRQVFPEIGGSTAGVYTSSDQGIFAVAFKPSDDYGDFIVKHEYYHHFMLQYFPGAYPAWMTEGLAEFFSTAQDYGGKTWVGASSPGQVTELDANAWIPLDEVISKSPFQIRDAGVLIYYAEAWLLTNYMMTDVERRKRLMAYVAALRSGEGSVKAWTEVVGEAPIETQKKLRLYLTRRLSGYSYSKDAKQTVEVSVTPMPASADDMLLEGQQLKAGVPEAREAALLAQVRADAAKHPNDRLADLTLARAELALGNPAAAETLLNRRMAADANDKEARLLMAALRMKTADAMETSLERRLELYREADKLLVPLVKAEPDDFRVFYEYARSRSVEPGYPSENMVKVLLTAVELGPQVASLRFAAADASAIHGEYDQAILVLKPVAADPHNSAVASAAQKRIDDFQARKAKAAQLSGKPGA